MIQCVCSYFNFTNNPIRKRLYQQFRNKFQHPLITIEVALDKSDFFIDDSYKILANPDNILWQKERCFNIVLEGLSDTYDKIVWIDTDIVFHNDNWLDEMDKALDSNIMCQSFESVVEYKPSSTELSENITLNADSWAKSFSLYDNDHSLPEPYLTALGLSWGINRTYIPVGFFDKHILGSNNVLQFIYTIGDCFNNQLIHTCTQGLLRSWINYSRFMPYSQTYNIGYCSGVVEHMYHGSIDHRGYQIREKILYDHGFDPQYHLEIDSTNGLYKIVNHDLLKQDIIEYFGARHRGTYDVL